MTRSVRRALVVGGAGVALLVAFIVARDDTPQAAAARPAHGAARTSSAQDVPVADVRLELLQSTPAELEDVERNLFRFGSGPASPAAGPSPAASMTPGRLAPPVAVAPGPPAIPAIPLRYIGLLDAPAQAGRVAVLSDGRGNIFYGREGDTIEGRYRVLQVSPVATELSYLDGRGRQTIRLSGQ